MKTFASLFSGGGGADLGAIAAGLTHLWGVEHDAKIAKIYQQNIGEVVCRDILELDPSNFDSPDWLHASPPCQSFSTANAKKGEKNNDIKIGHKVAEFIEVLQPQYFSLENVRAYRDSRSFQIIVEALNANGYNCQSEIINATDYGVPQSRERLFLIAYKGDLRWFWNPFASSAKQVGWYEAIADLLPSLPDSKLADWQIKALPEEIRNHLLLNVRASQNSVIGIDPKECDQPSFTVPATVAKEIPKALLVHPTDQRTIPIVEGEKPAFTTTTNKGGNHTKALLIESTGARSDRPLQTRDHDKPCWTIRAMGQDGHYHKAHVLERAKIKQLDIPCLARLQGFPDSYQWSGHRATDGTIIGNSVCPPVMQKLIENIINWRS
jgi:DNA (cytosine-5)-methyltransferase 1